MPNPEFPPLSVLVLATVMGCGGLIVALQFIHQSPWLGIEWTSDDGPGLLVSRLYDNSQDNYSHSHSHSQSTLATGTRVVAVRNQQNQTIPLNSQTLHANLEFLASYADFNQHWRQLARITDAVQNGQLTVITDQGETQQIAIQPQRPLTSLPFAFWLLCANAATTYLLGIGVWAFRQRSKPAMLLCLCGISLAVHHTIFAITLAKPILVDANTAIWLLRIAHGSGSLFFYAGTALIWHYPQPLHRFPMGRLLFFGWAAACVIISNQWLEFPLNSFDSHLLPVMVAALVFAYQQWTRSKQQPQQRAALKWFLFTIFINMTIVSLLWGLPFIVLGRPVIPKYFMSVFLLLIYLGFVAGVVRYRLFELDRWWFNAWVWLAAIIPIALVDLLLIYFLHLNWQPLLLVSAIVLGWLYFPIKHWLLARMFARVGESIENYLPNFIEALYSDAAPESQWRQLLDKVYSPLQWETVADCDSSVALHNDGLTLQVPRLNDQGAYRLTGRNHSSKLFSSNDAKLAESLFALLQQATDIRTAREAGARQEREKNMSLFATVSHEFRTPLTLIIGPLKQLQQELAQANANDSTQKKLALVQRNSERMLYLVDELIELACINVGEQRRRQTIELQAVCRECCLAVSPLAEAKGLTLTQDLTGPWWLTCYQDAVHKVLFNLLSNAVKYSSQPGNIHLELKKETRYDKSDKEFLVIRVQDQGPGIPESEQAEIFNQFTRLTDDTSQQGFGLGLATVKELVSREDGLLELTSRLGEGACFTVLLPYDPELTGAEADATDLEQDGSKHVNRYNTVLDDVNGLAEPFSHSIPEIKSLDLMDSQLPVVLVIEDHSDMRRFIVSSLQPNYQLLEADNGNQGIATAVETIPDLILCDVMMPGQDGFQVCEHLKQDERTSHIPIVLLTARDDKASRMTGWQHHADEYLSKPFDVDELRLRVQNLLSIRQLLRQRFSEQKSSLLLNTESASNHSSSLLNSLDQAFLDRMEGVLVQHYSNPEFNLAAMAQAMAKSERQLHRKFKALTDKTPMEYLRWYRLQEAARLLKQQERASDVAHQVGFSSASYFSNCFKSYFGKTPRQYRDSHAQSTSD